MRQKKWWIVVLVACAGTVATLGLLRVPERKWLELSMPVRDQRASPVSSFRYYLRRAAPGMPTVVYLPGGPGDTVSTDPDVAEIIPEPFGLLLFDNRQTGLNAKFGAAEERLTTQILAADTATLIARLELTDYALYAHSYGTWHATILLNLLEERSLQVPRFALLEGSLGRSFRSVDEVNQAALALGQRYLATMSAEARALLRESDNGSGSEAGTILVGLISGYGRYAVPFVEHAASQRSSEDLRLFREAVNLLREPAAFEDSGLYRDIVCSEIAPHHLSFRFELAANMLRLVPAAEENRCGLHAFRPMDMSAFPSKTRLYYIHGEDDPKTPLWQAEHHFRGQGGAGSNRQFFVIPGAGHSPLRMQLGDCRSAVWLALANAAENLESVLQTCLWVRADHGKRSLRPKAVVLPPTHP